VPFDAFVEVFFVIKDVDDDAEATRLLLVVLLRLTVLLLAVSTSFLSLDGRRASPFAVVALTLREKAFLISRTLRTFIGLAFFEAFDL